MTKRTEPKSHLTQLLLTVLFGPLGLLYSSIPGAVLVVLAAVVLVKDFGPIGVLFAWLAALPTGLLTVHHWNRMAAKYRGCAQSRASDAVQT